MHIISHSTSSFLTGVIGRIGLAQIIKRAWSGIRTGQRQMKSLVLGVRWGQKRGIFFSLGFHTTIFQAKI